MKNLEDILAMANKVQEELAKAQDSLDELEIEGVSGGGLVKVLASAKGRIIRVTIDPSLLTTDSKEMTEDLIVAALNDTRARADEAARVAMKHATHGLPFPPDFTL